MNRIKIDYGIDLGTTNSAIAKIMHGNVKILKSDFYQKDTIPSCVGFVKVKDKCSILVGDEAYNQLDRDRRLTFYKSDYHSEIFIEFKRTMGTDKTYPSLYMNRNYTSEELSAEVLKKLKSFEKDEVIKSIIITVPAKFKMNQKEATVRAAKLAGFEYCELIQEPVAASLAFGLDSEIKNGYWIVFDFGGGTFDVALMKVEEGIMNVIDTDGDAFLGGKNIDYAIIDEILIPYFKNNYNLNSVWSNQLKLEDFRNEWKGMVEYKKIELSIKDTVYLLTELGEDFGMDDDNNPLELDITLTKEEFERVVRPIFQKAIDITNNLLSRNKLTGNSLETLILVGGPTRTPLLRQMIMDQITPNIDTHKDPMTVVAEGAALYASTVDIPESIIANNRDNKAINLQIKFESSSVELNEFVSVKINEDSLNNIQLDNNLFLEISRGTGWSTGKIPFNPKGEVVEVKLEPNKANIFEINIYNSRGDRLAISPNEFTILQGFKQGQNGATLPYYIGIEVHDDILNRDEFIPIKGLEKNATTPITGIENGCRTPKVLRPGISTDIINIPIYQGDYYNVGTKAFYNHYIANIRITGDDVPALIPENSPINLTFKIKRDEQMSVSAYFPNIDYTIEKAVEICSTTLPESNMILEYIDQAIQQAEYILGDSHPEEKIKITKELNDLKIKLKQGGSDYDRQSQVMEGLKQQQIAIDRWEKELELPKMEKYLEDVYDKLEELIDKLDSEKENMNDQLNSKLNQFTLAVKDIRDRKTKLSKDKNNNQYNYMRSIKILSDEIEQLYFIILDFFAGIQMKTALLYQLSENFNTINWTDPQKANYLINKGLRMSDNNPDETELLIILQELIQLMPYETQSKLLKQN